MEIIRERTLQKRTHYEHTFRWEDIPGWAGYGFVVDEKGKLLSDNLDAIGNYNKCISGQMCDRNGNAIIDEGKKAIVSTYYEPALGKCKCGEIVQLESQYMGACDCPKCGRWYNMAGQELKNPSEWED